MTRKRAAQLDAEIAEAIRTPPRKTVRCKRCKGVGYINTTPQKACPDCDKLGKVMDHATKKSAGYYVGAELRDELISEIDSLGWEGEDTDGVLFVDRAQKVKTALQSATAHRKGFLFDVDGWAWQDYDFLKTILVDGVMEDMGHTASSRGISLGGTLIGRQIRALREKL